MKISEIEQKYKQNYNAEEFNYIGSFELYKDGDNYYILIADESSSGFKRKVLNSEDISNAFIDYFETQI